MLGTGACMYRAKRKAPVILMEPFYKTDGAFRQKKSLCLISCTLLSIEGELLCEGESMMNEVYY